MFGVNVHEITHYANLNKLMLGVNAHEKYKVKSKYYNLLKFINLCKYFYSCLVFATKWTINKFNYDCLYFYLIEMELKQLIMNSHH